MRALLIRSILLAIAVPAVVAPTAVAGVYEVSGCSSWSAQASYYVGAYRDDCSVRSGGGGYFASASLAFTAAPGTAVAAIRGNHFSTQQGGWQVGVFDFDKPDGFPRRWLWCGPGTACSTFGLERPLYADSFRTSRIGLLQICGSGGGCASPSSFSLRGVTLVVEDPTAPNVAVNASGGWLRGTQLISNDANDNTGIRTLRLLVDGRERNRADRGCDLSQAVQCPQGGADFRLDTTLLGDGRHTVRVEGYDASGNGNAAETAIAVDNTAPDAVGDLGVEGGDSWRPGNTFDLSWVAPDKQVAPVEAIELELCPSGVKSGDSKCRRSTRPVADLPPATAGQRSVLKKVEVATPGEWTAALWLRDQAGNQNQQTARTVVLRHDPEPPALAFRALDPADPTRLRVAGSDTTSGIAGAQIELQRRGGNVWQPLDTQLEENGFTASLDDATLPDGAYNLRARAVDRAGNERSTDRFAGGEAAELTLPVRIKTRLVAGRPREVRVRQRRRGGPRYRTVLNARPRVRYGPAVRLQGRLTTPGANPLPGTELRVFAEPQAPGQAAQQVGTVTTSRTGRFSFRVAKGPSRVVSFRYVGTKTIRSDVAAVELRVRSSTSFRPSRRSVRNGETLTFRGRLRGGWIPAGGKLIALQVRARGSWRPFATTRAGGDGRWVYRYRFDGTRGLIRYGFRALVVREATYPFTTGGSGVRRVLVRGARR